MEKIKKCKNYYSNNLGHSRSLYNFLEILNFKDYQKLFINKINLENKSYNILEIGCGIGILINELNTLFTKHNYYAINMPHFSSNIGYQKFDYDEEYIISFFKKFNLDLSNKKLVKHYFDDMFVMSKIPNNSIDLIFSQSTFGKSLVSIKDPNILQNKIKHLFINISNKLKSDGELFSHIDCIPKFNYNERNICEGIMKINNKKFYFNIYLAKIDFCQSDVNNKCEICLYLKNLEIAHLNTKFNKNSYLLNRILQSKFCKYMYNYFINNLINI